MRRLAASAKVNLFLHVGARRSDGLHELNSLAMPASVGDMVCVCVADVLEVVVRGRNAAALEGSDNLVLAAAGAVDSSGVARIELDKELPVGAGLGGGSADAAAAMILLNRLWECGLPDEELAARGMKIGADVPACLQGCAVMVSGAGEVITPVRVPEFHAVLVDTGAHVSTAAVFAAFDAAAGSLCRPVGSGGLAGDDVSVIDWLIERTRNDLTEAAVSVCPGIAEALEMLAGDDDVLLARMTGSGGACFGLCAGPEDARAISARILSRRPGWWVRDCVLRGWGHRSTGVSRRLSG